MNRRTRRTLWIVAAVMLLLAVAIFLRSKAPPEAARLLPESDGILYINESARPSEPWYVILSKIVPYLLMEPYRTFDCHEDVDSI